MAVKWQPRGLRYQWWAFFDSLVRDTLWRNLKISTSPICRLFYFLSSRIFRKTTQISSQAYKTGKKHRSFLFWFNEFNVIIPQWFSPFGPHWRRLEALGVIEVEANAGRRPILDV
jgi:hypothetical protein